MKITIPIRLVSEANVKEHWGAKYRRSKEQKRIMGLFINKPFLKKLGVVKKVKLTRICKRCYDSDNLARSFKSVRDFIADVLGTNDAWGGIEWKYDQRKGDHGIEVQFS